jgi:hypothetical protein
VRFAILSAVTQPAGKPRPLYLHIGASKTGTSALQQGLFDSVPALAGTGIGVPLVSRDEHVRAVLRPFGWQTAYGFVDEVRRDRLEALVPLLQETPGDRLLMTCEDVCELDPPRIAALAEVVDRAGLELRVVLTLRNLASVVPSEWQQFLKHRLTLDYPTFLERVRDRRGRWARHFWERQDVVAICERWTDVVGADRLVAIVTPDRSADPQGLYRMFGEVVGFSPDRLNWPDRNVNASWGYVEAEVYRRVNLALGDRLSHYERQYQPGVRWPFVQAVLPRDASARIPLPPEHLPWVRAVASEHRDFLRGGKIRVHGDVDALVPDPTAARELPALEDSDIAQAAVQTLANLAVFAARRRGRGPGRDTVASDGTAFERTVGRFVRRWRAPRATGRPPG